MRWIIKCCFILISLITLSCATITLQEEAAGYEKRIKELVDKLQANPEDGQTLRELGVIYFNTRQYARARPLLEKAYRLQPQDPKTMFYRGFSLEFENEVDEALAIYQKYQEVPRTSPYRKLMAGRYRWLTREEIRREMKTLLAREEELTSEALSSSRVAVFPLHYQGQDEQYNTLGKGLSEMMIIDLGRVNQLTLVERVRLQALLDELQFSRSAAVDPATAPRMGKLLSAGRLIQGSYNVMQKSQLRLDVAQWDVLEQQFPAATSETDALDNLFKVEKDLVFQIIEQMGIQLTEAERSSIQYVPTRNLQAFLAYCMGLEQEDGGNFRRAEQFYLQAVQLDPDFSLAEDKAVSAGGMSEVGGSKEQAAAAVAALDQPTQMSGVGELVNGRLQQVTGNLGSTFVPGPDSRKAPEEATGGGLENLPDPPRPPDSGGGGG